MNIRLLLIILLFTSSCNGLVKNYKDVIGDYKRDVEESPGLFISYSGDSLRTIAFPLGGIGTGNLLLGGRGNILENEIFGRPCLDEVPPYMTFFSVWGRDSTGRSFARVLEGELPDHYPNPFGVPRNQLGGVPRFEDCSFTGHFPYANICLRDPKLALEFELSAWNPFIPLDTRNSSLPVSVFDWTVKNPSNKSFESVLAFNFGNPFFENAENMEKLNGEVYVIENDSMHAVVFRQNSPFNAELMIVSDQTTSLVNNRWFRGSWWDNAQVFWDNFMKNGGQQYIHCEKYSFSGKDQDVASLYVPFKIKAGESREISFYVFWRIPERQAENSMSLGSGQTPGMTYENYYCKDFSDVSKIASLFFKEQDYLRSKTQSFHDILFSSSFPPFVKDAIASNLAGLNSNLIMRNNEGIVHAFEGLGNDFGCCPGNCTHVWNYAQSLAFLFPDLERNMRETNYLHDTHSDGYQSFRTVFPPENYWLESYAADGQMGTIIRAYREWKYSGNTEWLSGLWEKIKLSLEFSWKGRGNNHFTNSLKSNSRISWDPGKKGIITGDQHNTYDINFFGPNMLTGSLYLGALKAASEMATAMGEGDKAHEYEQLYESGKKQYQKILWNGEYYEQKISVDSGIVLPEKYLMPKNDKGEVIPKYQFGSGCLSDQLLGQFLADCSGLGYIMDSIYTRRALLSVYNFNFIRDFSEFQNIQRIYAANQEAGLVLCTWPNGNKPLVPFVYSDEVWTGVEYQVASSLIYEGLVEEGLEIVKAVRDRYKGYNRNPFAEIESGRFYARSFSSYGLLTSLSGYSYDGVNRQLGFHGFYEKPDFYSFWSTGDAWGSFKIRNKAVILKVYHGKLELNEFSFRYPSKTKIQEVNTDTREIKYENNICKLKLHDNFNLEEGDKLIIVVE